MLDRLKSMPPFDPTKPNPMIESLFKILETFVSKVKSWPGYEELYGETMDQWDRGKFMSCFMDVCAPMKCGLTVLNHADLWVNNFLFAYDGDLKPTDCIFIDFQGSFWGSPTNDLL